jgi:hypothetical protein
MPPCDGRRGARDNSEMRAEVMKPKAGVEVTCAASIITPERVTNTNADAMLAWLDQLCETLVLE